MTISEDIDFFFDDPTQHPQPLRRPLPDNSYNHSTLYLLRREAQDCFIGTVIAEDDVLAQTNRRRIFATAMVLFAGIDLLGKFVAGCTARGEPNETVATRFRRFATDLMELSPEQANALYSARNSIMHSFGLYDPQKRARVAVTYERPPVKTASDILRRSAAYEVLYVDHLYAGFIAGLKTYEKKLRTDTGMQQAFESAFGFYGPVAIR